MSTLEDLTAQRAALDRQIAEKKAEAVRDIRERMAKAGVTIEDLGPPMKYRDAQGNEWTGVGRRPRWLREAMLAGAALDDFRVKL